MTEAAFRQFAALLPEAMLLLRCDGTVAAVNPAAAALLGCAPGALVGRPLGELVTDAPSKLDRYLGLCARSRTLVLGALTWRAKDGPLPTRCDGAVLPPSPEDPGSAFLLLRCRPREIVTTRFVALGQKIDQLNREVAVRKEAEAALRRSEERLQLALTAARAGTWHWDVRADRVHWDESLHRIFGVAGQGADSYAGFLEWVHPDDRPFVAAAVERALHGGTLLDHEFRIVRPDGRVRWVADHAKVVLDPDGAPAAVAGVCVDVTERRELDEQLRQVQRLESVGRLAGGVAHEANNQMTVILGAADFLLRRGDLPAGVRDDLAAMQAAAERTAAVTGQLLAFSRRQVLRPELVDLNGVVQGMLGVIQRTLGENCAVALQFARDLGRVRVDRGQLEQVILNLVLNARDAMPNGGRLTIETTAVALGGAYQCRWPGVRIREGAYAVLVVTDTGTGMTRETMRHIFEPFFTTKGPGRGTGLGLSTVYGIVKQSDGYIWAYSEPGQGTAFKVYLPLAEASAEAEPPGPAVPASNGAGETILLVEDERVVREIACRILREAGYQVFETSDGNAALELATRSEHRIDLVLTDLAMPGMGGRELAERLAAVRPGVPVLFTSGYTAFDILRRELLAPGLPFIEKPFTPDALTAKVRGVLARGRVVRRE